MLRVPCDSRYDFLPFLPSFKDCVFLFPLSPPPLISIFRVDSKGLVIQEWRFTVQVPPVLLPLCIRSNHFCFWCPGENESKDVKSWGKQSISEMGQIISWLNGFVCFAELCLSMTDCPRCALLPAEALRPVSCCTAELCDLGKSGRTKSSAWAQLAMGAWVSLGADVQGPQPLLQVPQGILWI